MKRINVACSVCKSSLALPAGITQFTCLRCGSLLSVVVEESIAYTVLLDSSLETPDLKGITPDEKVLKSVFPIGDGTIHLMPPALPPSPEKRMYATGSGKSIGFSASAWFFFFLLAALGVLLLATVSTMASGAGLLFVLIIFAIVIMVAVSFSRMTDSVSDLDSPDNIPLIEEKPENPGDRLEKEFRQVDTPWTAG